MTQPMTVPTQPAIHSDADASRGARAVSVDGRVLPLEATTLRADARGGIARVVLEQRFRNPHTEPLRVTYSLPLPEDGAVSGFAFRVADQRVVGVVEPRGKARERFEQAVIDGHSAALLEQDRGSLFTQEIGNVPPGATLVVEVTVDQKLRWLDEGAWEWRFPTVVGPRYLGAQGRVPDAARIAQDIATSPLATRTALALAIRDALAGGRRPESPSHTLRATDATGGGIDVELGGDGLAPLDRDVVVRWSVATPAVGLALDLGRPVLARASSRASYGLLTVVPPSTPVKSLARDLTVLIDASGSMGGEPIEQAKRVTAAMIATLGERDSLELIAFANTPVRWKREPARATEATKREALAWLRGLRSAGGTEMREGVMEALRPLRAESQRQVVLITDGYIGFEREIIEAIAHHLPAGARLHTLGVGAAVNRSLTGPAARAGRGLEAIVSPGEDPERVAMRLLTRTSAPLVVDLEVSGSALVARAPARSPDLFAGAPALLALALRPEGGELVVHGRTADGTWEQRLTVPARLAGEGPAAPAALYAREAVEDQELALAAGGSQEVVNTTIETLGVEHQIATRLTSWVAVSEIATVDPLAPSRRERMPHELPAFVSAEGVGLRAASYGMAGMAAPVSEMGTFLAGPERSMTSTMAPPSMQAPMGGRGAPSAPPSPSPKQGVIGRMLQSFGKRDADEARDGASESRSRSGTRHAGPASARPPAPRAAAPVAQSPRRRARIVSVSADRVVLEYVAPGPIAWDTGDTIELYDATGARIACHVDLARTTRSGAVAAGQTLRVTLALEKTMASTPARLVLRRADGATLEFDLAS